jgi:molybdenum cofactor cytidylyltransferase
LKKSVNTEPIISGILLASGSSIRFGSPKQLLKWQGDYLINYVINEILKSQIDQLFVVLGDHYTEISQVIDLRSKIIYNTNWMLGKSSSIESGINHLGESVQGAIFFVVDQPYINLVIINKLILEFKNSPNHIIVPRIKGHICNPVLFGRNYFEELKKLAGENGGKVIIEKSQYVNWVDWDDEKLLLDIDTQKDYGNMIERQT